MDLAMQVAASAVTSFREMHDVQPRTEEVKSEAWQALELAITAIIRDRDEAMASLDVKTRLLNALEEGRTKLLNERRKLIEERPFIAELDSTRHDRDEWKKRTEEAEALMLKSWRCRPVGGYWSCAFCRNCGAEHAPDCIITRLTSEG